MKLKCDFCGGVFDDTTQTFEDGRSGSLITGNGAFICDECIDTCKTIVDENRALYQIRETQGYCELGSGYFQ